MKKCNIDDCSIYKCQKLIKHKWVPIVIYCVNRDISSFNALLNQIDHISNAELSRTLKLLILENIFYLNDNSYELTPKGIKLNNIINLMMDFDQE